MEKQTVLCYEGFQCVGRSEMMTVEGGDLKKIVEVVKTVVKIIQAIAEFSECVDDFLEGYKEGLEEARGH